MKNQYSYAAEQKRIMILHKWVNFLNMDLVMCSLREKYFKITNVEHHVFMQ